MKRKPIKQVAKPHRILLQAIVNSLNVIFTEGKYADKVIEKTLKENPKFGGRDRRFIAETTYDIVRNYRLLSYLANTTTDFWQIPNRFVQAGCNEMPNPKRHTKGIPTCPASR